MWLRPCNTPNHLPPCPQISLQTPLNFFYSLKQKVYFHFTLWPLYVKKNQIYPFWCPVKRFTVGTFGTFFLFWGSLSFPSKVLPWLEWVYSRIHKHTYYLTYKDESVETSAQLAGCLCKCGKRWSRLKCQDRCWRRRW